MSKIHLEVEIPGNAKTYVFMLDDRMKIGTAKKQIMKQIAELEAMICLQDWTILFLVPLSWKV